MFLIAPLSANTLAKISHGLCDNLLTSVARAWDYNKPMLIAPAMNTFMWDNPLTGEQLKKMESLGAMVISPVIKTLACGDTGKLKLLLKNWYQNTNHRATNRSSYGFVGSGALAPVDEVLRIVVAKFPSQLPTSLDLATDQVSADAPR